MSNKIYRLENYSQENWKVFADIPNDALPVKFISGENTAGIFIIGGNSGNIVYVMSNYTDGTWRRIPSPPNELLPIKFASGENHFGIIVAGGRNENLISYLDNYSTGVWRSIPDTAPFAIQGLTGRNNAGPVIFGGNNRRAIAYIDDYGSPRWKRRMDSPFPIERIVGGNDNGIAVSGLESEPWIAYANPLAIRWTLLPTPPARVGFLTGDIVSGLALIPPGGEFVSHIETDGNIYHIVDAPMPQGRVEALTGENNFGPILLTV